MYFGKEDKKNVKLTGKSIEKLFCFTSVVIEWDIQCNVRHRARSALQNVSWDKVVATSAFTGKVLKNGNCCSRDLLFEDKTWKIFSKDKQNVKESKKRREAPR